MDSLADRLRKERTRAKLSQTELAKRAGIKTQSLIGNLETGQQQSSTFLPQIAQVLGVDVNWLATGKGNKSAEHDAAANQNAAPYDVFTPDELAILETYRKLTRSQQADLLRGAVETQLSNKAILDELTRKNGNDNENGNNGTHG